MKFFKKYKHVGYSYPAVPNGWVPIAERVIRDIERVMWPQRWLPRPAKRLIHRLATDNSVVRVRSWFWYRVRTRLTGGQMITDVKDKYATLRIYGSLSNAAHAIVERAEAECAATCEDCGRRGDEIAPGSRYPVVETVEIRGWYRNVCHECAAKYGEVEAEQ